MGYTKFYRNFPWVNLLSGVNLLSDSFKKFWSIEKGGGEERNDFSLYCI